MQCLGTWLVTKDFCWATPPARSASAPHPAALGTHRQAAHLARSRQPQARGAARDRAARRPAQRHAAGDALSARNRFPGVVRSVEVDGVMALVEIEAGPHLVTAAVTRDAVEELGLAPGVAATAAVKATSVMVERGKGSRSRWAWHSPRWAQVAGTTTRTETPPQPKAASRPARGLRGRVDDRGARACAPEFGRRGGRRCSALVRRLGRARGADPPGRQPTLRRGQHELRGALRRGPGRASRGSSRPTSSSSLSPGSDIHSSTTCADGVKVAVGSESVPIGSYTRETLAKFRRSRRRPSSPACARTSPTSRVSTGSSPAGAGDAGFVYVTDVNATCGELQGDRAARRARADVTYGADGRQGREAAGRRPGVRRRTQQAGALSAEESGFRPAAATPRARLDPGVLLGPALVVGVDPS